MPADGETDDQIPNVSQVKGMLLPGRQVNWFPKGQKETTTPVGV